MIQAASQQLLTILATTCKRIRSKLVEYGLSENEINCHLAELVQDEQQQKCIGPQSCTDKKQKQNTNEQGQQRQASCLEIVARQLSKNKNNIQRYLVRIIRKLEIQLFQLEEYQKANISHNLQTEHSGIMSKLIKEESSKGVKECQKSQVIQTLICNKNLNHETETQVQIKYLQEQQLKLKTSLRNMVERTKLLRAILERQIILSSIHDAEGLNEAKYMHRQFMV